MDTHISDAIAAELRYWQVDGRRFAADSLVRIAELLHSHGADLDLPTFYARRDCRVLDR